MKKNDGSGLKKLTYEEKNLVNGSYISFRKPNYAQMMYFFIAIIHFSSI